MSTLTRLSSGLALLCGSLVWALSSFSADAASITTQPRCTGPSGYCLSFGSADTIPVIRSFNFTAPKAGTAQVTFHGSLYCGISTNTTTFARIDLVSQIVDRKNAVPDLSKAGSLRHAAGYTSNNTFHGWSTSFSLASTRVFTISAAGTQRYYFKIERLLQDANVTCYVYNATFTIVFI
ncbi:MAG: hypothetical protein GEU91_09400 [Rhizobiales bacterium]|nr:hypothetical protein [Hyphomicrobiales bacterium]